MDGAKRAPTETKEVLFLCWKASMTKTDCTKIVALIYPSASGAMSFSRKPSASVLKYFCLTAKRLSIKSGSSPPTSPCVSGC